MHLNYACSCPALHTVCRSRGAINGEGVNKLPSNILDTIGDYVVGTPTLIAAFLYELIRPSHNAKKNMTTNFVASFLDDILEQLAGEVQLPCVWISNQCIDLNVRVVKLDKNTLGCEWDPLFERWNDMLQDPDIGLTRELTCTTVGELFIAIARVCGDKKDSLAAGLLKEYQHALTRLACDLAFIIDSFIPTIVDEDGLTHIHDVKLGKQSVRKRKRNDWGPRLIQ